MKVVTINQMRQMERRCADRGMPSEVLMENAGLAVAKEIARLSESLAGQHILALIGPGNNGGDGLVAARYLHLWGARVFLYICGDRPEADPNYLITRETGIPSARAAEDQGFSILEEVLSSAKIVLDALFGTGKSRPLEGMYRQVLDRVAGARRKGFKPTVVALDLPSGLDADTGAADPACLAADLTITLGYPKLGLFSFPGAQKVGRLTVADIGIPLELAEAVDTEVISAEWARSVIPGRPSDANKGTFGRVLVVAGSINYIGAAYLACTAAFRVGAGLVTLATARSLQSILASKLTEVTYIPLPEAESGNIAAQGVNLVQEWLPRYDVLLMGCGLGRSISASEFVTSCISLLKDPRPVVVMDADALNILAGVPQWWQRVGPDAILTPHPGEMARLTGLSVEGVQAERVNVARRFAALWQKTVVLKGAYTVVAASNGRVRISPVANPGLASAGTGDVLAGAIAGLLAQGLSQFDAAACGVYLHGCAGEIVKGELGDAGMIASDLLPALPLVIKRLKEKGQDVRPEEDCHVASY